MPGPSVLVRDWLACCFGPVVRLHTTVGAPSQLQRLTLQETHEVKEEFESHSSFQGHASPSRTQAFFLAEDLAFSSWAFGGREASQIQRKAGEEGSGKEVSPPCDVKLQETLFL